MHVGVCKHTQLLKRGVGSLVVSVKASCPQFSTNCRNYRFPGRGQKKTPITDLRGAIELTFLLPGRHAAQVRRQAAELLVRYLGGDLSLVDEVCMIHGLQEELAVRAPNDPRRIFGDTIETSSSTSGPPFARMLSDMHERLLKQEQMLTQIHQSLEHDRQRVNLNVHAPKRAMQHQPQIARDIAGEWPFLSPLELPPFC